MAGEQLNIIDGEAFFAHELSINFNPTQFILDFKNVTPRVDLRSKDKPSITIKHNVVMAEAYHAKMIYELLGRMVKKYEDEFGKIEKPAAVKKAEKKHKKSSKSKSKKTETPNYFG